MVAPTSEDLLILVNGQPVTDNIPAKSITIVDERGNRVSTCSFMVENAAALGIAQWQKINIYEADMSIQHFDGYIMSFTTKKRGISVDYTVQCSSIEILLQKAIINGSFTGTDDDLLTDILSNAYPDLSDIFDWSSDITPLSLSDLDLDLQDMTMLDALEALSGKVGGADYKQGISSGKRTNLMNTPGCNATALEYFNRHLIPGSPWATTFAAWSGLLSVNPTFGETGSGLRLPAQDFTGIGENWQAFVNIQRDPEVDPYTDLIRINRTENAWLVIRCRTFFAAVGGTFTVTLQAVTYDNNGNIYHDGTNITLAANVGGNAWDTFERAIDLSDKATIPVQGRIDIELKFSRSQAGTFGEIFLDSFIAEVKGSVTEPSAGTWFDGDTANARWNGETDESSSTLGKAPLTWGSAPNAAFDVDIGSMSELLSDFEYDFSGFDGLNAIIVDGGFQYTDIDWEYEMHGNAVNNRLVLETEIFPADTFTFPIVYTNIGDDTTPNWSTKTVGQRSDEFATKQVLYDQENHWLEFADAPPDLDRSVRITGRIKEPIRVIVQDADSVAETGVEMTGVLHIDTVTTPADAFNLGQAELDRRTPGANYKFTTNEPGLVAGAEIDIVDSLQSINDTALIIERVTRKYLGGGKGSFVVECGKFVPGLEDMLTENYNVTKPKLPVGLDQTALTVGWLIDQDSAALTDQDGNYLLDIS